MEFVFMSYSFAGKFRIIPSEQSKSDEHEDYPESAIPGVEDVLLGLARSEEIYNNPCHL